MIKGVIFDLDGVVVDSPKIYFRVMKGFLKKHHLKISDSDVSNLLGRSLKEELNQINKKYSLNISFEHFLSETLEKSLKLAKTELKTNPGIRELLFDLQKNDFLLGLASNNNMEAVDFFLKKFELQHFFSSIVSGNEVTKGKPNPHIYLKAVQKLGLKPTDCIAIEDTAIGVRSVKSAGLKCIAIPNSYTNKNSFPQADIVVESLFELNAQKISSL